MYLHTSHGTFLFTGLHPLDHFQPCELFSLFLFQCILDVLRESFVHRDRDIFQRIRTFLGLFDVGGQTVGGVFRSWKDGW